MGIWQGETHGSRYFKLILPFSSYLMLTSHTSENSVRKGGKGIYSCSHGLASGVTKQVVLSGEISEYIEGSHHES